MCAIENFGSYLLYRAGLYIASCSVLRNSIFLNKYVKAAITQLNIVSIFARDFVCMDALEILKPTYVPVHTSVYWTQRPRNWVLHTSGYLRKIKKIYFFLILYINIVRVY